MTRPEWLREALETLLRGESVDIHPTGNSMQGRINEGDLVTLSPIDTSSIEIGDIVLARVREHILVLHQILQRDDELFLIGNASGRTDDWVAMNDIFGRVTNIQAA